jgi:peptidoglycan/LPS O-acetylase OafA/YrhL
MNSNYISTLTPLRGIAAILVVVLHASIFLSPIGNPKYTGLIMNGWLWVDFFFILSGFILAYVYGKKFEQGVQWQDFKHYAGARFARVYPLHLITMIWAFLVGQWILALDSGTTVWSGFYKVIFDYDTLPTSAFLLQAMNFHSTAPLNTPSWSLSTEWWMYMLFPILVVPFFKLNKLGRIGAFLFIGLFFAALRYYIIPTFGIHFGEPTGETLNTINDLAIFRCMAGFLLGMLTFECYRHKIAIRWMRKSVTAIIISAGILLVMIFNWNELIVILLFALLILSAAFNTTSLKKILDGKRWQQLGDLSFSIYMVHMPIFFTYIAILFTFKIETPKGIIDENPNYLIGWIYCIGLLIVTLPVAYFFHHYIEIPLRNYLNGVFNPEKARVNLITKEI